MPDISYQKEFPLATLSLSEDDGHPGVPYSVDHLIDRHRYIDVLVQEGHPFLSPMNWHFELVNVSKPLPCEQLPPSFAGGVLFVNSGDDVIVDVNHQLIDGWGHYDLFTLTMVNLKDFTWSELVLIIEHNPPIVLH